MYTLAKRQINFSLLLLCHPSCNFLKNNNIFLFNNRKIILIADTVLEGRQKWNEKSNTHAYTHQISPSLSVSYMFDGWPKKGSWSPKACLLRGHKAYPFDDRHVWKLTLSQHYVHFRHRTMAGPTTSCALCSTWTPLGLRFFFLSFMTVGNSVQKQNLLLVIQKMLDKYFITLPNYNF